MNPNTHLIKLGPFSLRLRSYTWARLGRFSLPGKAVRLYFDATGMAQRLPFTSFWLQQFAIWQRSSVRMLFWGTLFLLFRVDRLIREYPYLPIESPSLGNTLAIFGGSMLGLHLLVLALQHNAPRLLTLVLRTLCGIMVVLLILWIFLPWVSRLS